METNNCIKNLLKFICVLQDNSENMFCLEDCCTKPYLGPTAINICYNTRVITLYNKQGNLFTAPYVTDGVINTSSTFRVVKVDDDCCTLLILENDGTNYISTRQTIVVKISCICAVKCEGDVIVNNL